MTTSGSDRESIWSVSPKWRTAYFALFSISHLLATRGDAHPVQVFVSIAEKAAVVGAAITLISAVAVTKGLMVIADYLRENWLEPLRKRKRGELLAQGRAEGLAVANTEWSQWNKAQTGGGIKRRTVR